MSATLKDDGLTEKVDAVVPCTDLDRAIVFFKEDCGFRLDLIFPADAPRVAIVSNGAVRIRLEAPIAGKRDGAHDELVVRRAGEWGTGRAGMQYRDLIPGRLGGRLIASHIRIPEGGPVPDYVHHHHVRFQIIYCYKGWVRVVYEDQGPPFVMQAGDCIVQPPHIRHRVLECSDAFEVVEVGSPAEHETLVDHEMTLPNDQVNRERVFDGQRFVFHQAQNAEWADWRVDGWEVRDTGIGEATGGEGSVIVLRPKSDAYSAPMSHQAESLFRFVLSGTALLAVNDDEPVELSATDSFVVPAGLAYSLSNASDDLEILEIALPADYSPTPAIRG